MISQLQGTIVSVGATWFVIDVGGVGLRAWATPATSARMRVGQPVTVQTSLVVREDSLTLYGFDQAAERDAFELAQSATGVGPKLAMAMVSVLDPQELAAAISGEDVARLCAVPGIGRKGAQRIILELKDKTLQLGQPTELEQPTVTSHWREQVAEGLQSLGWSAKDAESACDQIAEQVTENPDIELGALMKAALNKLARR